MVQIVDESRASTTKVQLRGCAARRNDSTAQLQEQIYVREKGVSKNVLAAEGFGDSRPVASNDTPQGRAQNGRVEIVISEIDQ